MEASPPLPLFCRAACAPVIILPMMMSAKSCRVRSQHVCTYIPGVCRLKASLQRVQRLTQGFTDGLLSLFPDRANALGAALGIQAERIQARRCPCWFSGLGLRI